MVLGLDVSTSCVGYAFTKNKKIIGANAVKKPH